MTQKVNEIMTKKQLAMALSKLRKIEGVDRKLEQYQTDSEIAADILWNAFMLGDIKGSEIYDLGCGNGILGIGALCLGAKKTIFIDKDKKAIEILMENIKDINGAMNIINNIINDAIENVNFNLIDDKTNVNEHGNEFGNENVSGNNKKKIVIMNPPFGTKQKHADKIFLEKAFSFSDIIYSIHKIESLDFIKAVSSANGFGIDRIWEYNFGIRRSHIKHKKDVYNVKVICVRLTK